jgi:hypothetical protein
MNGASALNLLYSHLAHVATGSWPSDRLELSGQPPLVAPVEVQDSLFVEGGYGGGADINGNAAQSRQISGRNGEAWIFGIACANARSGFENIGGRGQHTFLLARHADRALVSLRIRVSLFRRAMMVPTGRIFTDRRRAIKLGKVRIVPAGFTAQIWTTYFGRSDAEHGHPSSVIIELIVVDANGQIVPR